MTHTLSSVRRWRPAGLTAAADAVVSEVIEAHPDPATLDRRHRERPPATTATSR